MNKKIVKIIFLVAIILLISTINTTSNAAIKNKIGDKYLFGIMGDVDGNKEVNSKDSELILKYISGAKKLTILQKSRADVNYDGKINSKDAKEILEYCSTPKIVKNLSSISISTKPTKLEYEVGNTLKTAGLKIKLSYTDGSSKEVTSGFTCSPTNLNTVGSQKITVSYSEGNISKTTTFNVTVKQKVKNVTSVTINSSVKEVEVGKTIQLTATVKPEDASNKKVTWSSNKTNIATVDNNGQVKGIAEGDVTITATAADGSGKKNSVIITVKKPKIDYFTVKFNANSGKGTMTDQKITYGVQTELKANAFTKSGYKFNGWYAKRDDETWYVKDKNGNQSWQKSLPSGGSYVKYNNKTSVAYTASAGHSVTMYAQWKKIDEKVYTFNNTQYKIAVTKPKLNDVLEAIKDSKFTQGNKGGNCFVYAAVHSLMVNGKITTPKYYDNYSYNSSAYSESINCSTKAEYYAKIKEYIDKGKAIIIEVGNTYSRTGYHWVTVVGYKENCTQFNDLLLLGSSSGKLIQGSNSGETNNGLYSYSGCYFTKAIK